jgi:ribosomal protein S27AE
MAQHKMTCPKCGVEMNHHADKLIYADEKRSVATNDPSLGGIIEETNQCPACGAVASRRAQ